MAWPPTVDDLRQEVQTTRNDSSLHRILQAAVNVVTLYGLDEAVSENHALQLAVTDVQFDALKMESKGGAQMVKEHVRARNGILIELSRLRTDAARGASSGADTVTGPATVPAIAAAPTGTDPIRYLLKDELFTRYPSTTPPKDHSGQRDDDRVEALLDDASVWCAATVPGNLVSGGKMLPVADVPLALLGTVKQVCSDLVSQWLSPRAEKYAADCAACEARAAMRLKAMAQAVSG